MIEVLLNTDNDHIRFLIFIVVKAKNIRSVFIMLSLFMLSLKKETQKQCNDILHLILMCRTEFLCLMVGISK